MRKSGGNATLGELMGTGFEHRTQLTLDDLPKLLGEKMPKLSYDRVGKSRLLNALQIRFGDGFRNIPGVSGILKEFDKEMAADVLVKMNRRK